MKFSGIIGFYEENVLIRPGVTGSKIEEKRYTGDLYDNNYRWSQASERVSDNVSVNMRLSIIADSYAYDKWPSIRYVVMQKVKWRVTNIQVSYPRLILTLGEVYNGD